VGLAVFTAASAAAALAPNVDALIAARAVRRLGGAIVMPLTLTLLASVVPTERARPRLRLLGRHERTGRRLRPGDRGITEYASWQWIFLDQHADRNPAVPMVALIRESRGS
jgi:hypothetical protein